MRTTCSTGVTQIFPSLVPAQITPRCALLGAMANTSAP